MKTMETEYGLYTGKFVKYKKAKLRIKGNYYNKVLDKFNYESTICVGDLKEVREGELTGTNLEKIELLNKKGILSEELNEYTIGKTKLIGADYLVSDGKVIVKGYLEDKKNGNVYEGYYTLDEDSYEETPLTKAMPQGTDILLNSDIVRIVDKGTVYIGTLDINQNYKATILGVKTDTKLSETELGSYFIEDIRKVKLLKANNKAKKIYLETMPIIKNYMVKTSRLKMEGTVISETPNYIEIEGELVDLITGDSLGNRINVFDKQDVKSMIEYIKYK